MRTKLRSKFTLLFMLFGLLLAIPAVSVLMVVGPHPLVLLMSDSPSSTSQLTFTSLVYQLFSPSVPATVGVITGGVVSDGGGAAFTCSVNLAGVVL